MASVIDTILAAFRLTGRVRDLERQVEEILKHMATTEAQLDEAIAGLKAEATALKTRVTEKTADLQNQIYELKANNPDLSDELADIQATTDDLKTIAAPTPPPPPVE